MAVEGLVLVHPTDSAKNITLNGSKWGLEDLDLGNPARREELVASLDASGAVPFRVAPRDNREVTARLRLLDAATMNAAMDSIGALEALLNEAERFAADDPDDPVTDLVRLVYTPADSTRSFSLIVYGGDITGIPRTLSGEDAGFFIKRPVVTIRAICDPLAYGAGVTSPTRTTWLDTTVSGTDTATSVKVPASGSIAGDVSPWTRVLLEDDASQARNRIVLGLRQGEGSVIPSIAVGDLTAVVGTVSSGVMTATSTEWVVAAQLARQTRTGSFRVYLHDATSASTGSVRLIVAPAGSSRRTGTPATVSAGTTTDLDLGEVSADSSWDAWIETIGSVKFAAVILVPTDSFVEVTGAAPGRQLVGKTSVSDTLKAVASDIDNRSLTAGEHSGSWDTASAESSHITGSNLWPLVNNGVSQYGARRTMASMTVPAFAIAGTRDYLDVDVQVTMKAGKGGSTDIPASTTPFMGVVLRYIDTSNYLVAGFAYDTGAWYTTPGLWKVVSGTFTRIWTGERRLFGGGTVSGGGDIYFGGSATWRIQTTADGRYFAELATEVGEGNIFSDYRLITYSESTAGQDADLASGGALGNAAEARVGLFDYNPASTPTVTREWREFSVFSLAAVTPAPIPADGELALAGPKLLTEPGAEHPYTGSSGVALRQGVDNNLTMFVRRGSTVAGVGAASTEPLGVNVSGWPRYLSVPHG
jgi:hypothetical protein